MKKHYHSFTLAAPMSIKDAINSIQQYQQTKPDILLLPLDISFLGAVGQLKIIPGEWQFIYTLDSICHLTKIEQ